MALTNVQVAQQACIEVGLPPVQTMTDTTAEGKLIEAMYDMIVADALSRYTWRFACAQEELSLLSATPEGRWTYAFQLPSTVLTIKAITTVDQPIEFDQPDQLADAERTQRDAVWNLAPSNAVFEKRPASNLPAKVRRSDASPQR